MKDVINRLLNSEENAYSISEETALYLNEGDYKKSEVKCYL